MSLRDRIPIRTIAPILGLATIVGCASSLDGTGGTLSIADFSGTATSEVPAAGAPASGDRSRVEAPSILAAVPASPSIAPAIAPSTSQLPGGASSDAGVAWPVEGLLGQVNGRPIFADEFFELIEDQLRQAAANPDRGVGREQFIRIVRAAFVRTVESELVVAEAESQLTAEQQQGLLAWLRTIQEETIAERGGSRSAAEASLAAEEDKSLDEFMQQRRDVAIAGRLLNQKLEPRTIVSWREVQQAYERDRKIYNPPPQIRIGRIRFDSKAEIDKIERMKLLVSQGKTFPELVRAFDVPKDGVWQTSDLTAEGIGGLPLNDSVKSRLKDLKPGEVSQPLEQTDLTSWFSVVSIDTPVSRSIYDREVQLAIEGQLRAVRKSIERQRYIATLRSRWVNDDIAEIEQRLVDFALERYWR